MFSIRAFCLGEIDFNTVWVGFTRPPNFTTQSIPRRIPLFVAFVPLKAFRKWEIDFPLCHYVESLSRFSSHSPLPLPAVLALISFVTLNFFYVSKFGTIEEIKSQKGRVKQWRIKFAGPGVTMAQDMNNWFSLKFRVQSVFEQQHWVTGYKSMVNRKAWWSKLEWGMKGARINYRPKVIKTQELPLEAVHLV